MGVELEVLGRTNDRGPDVLGHAHRDHVLLDVLPELNACVEARCDDVHVAVVRRDIEHDVRVLASELTQLWGEHRHHGEPGDQ